MAIGLDWLATLLGLSGSYLLGHHNNRTGWLLLLSASILCGWINFNAGLMGMGIGSIGYALNEFVGYYRSHKRDITSKDQKVFAVDSKKHPIKNNKITKIYNK